jgi:hypothetical protein
MDVDEERDEGCLDFVVVVMKCSGRKREHVEELRTSAIRHDGGS